LKAVAMGMVTAITLFWSNKPNPARSELLIKKAGRAQEGTTPGVPLQAQDSFRGRNRPVAQTQTGEMAVKTKSGDLGA
jgi:hypothetical protein